MKWMGMVCVVWVQLWMCEIAGLAQASADLGPALENTNLAWTTSGSTADKQQSITRAKTMGPDSSETNPSTLSVAAWGAGKTNGAFPHYGQSIIPPGLSNVVAVAAGVYHNLALRRDGTVYSWGLDSSYRLTEVPAAATNVIAIAAGNGHSVALKEDRTMVVWGNTPTELRSEPPMNIVAIASGWEHILALTRSGTVLGWGRSYMFLYGQEVPPAGLRNVVALAAGAYHSLALKSDGTVVAWGCNTAGQTNVPPGLSNVVAIAAGASNSIALKQDGTIVAWGSNKSGQANIPTWLTNAVAITAGGDHVLAVTADGRLAAWGDNAYGQIEAPAGLTNISRIAAGRYHSLVTMVDGPISFLTQPSDCFVGEGEAAILSALTVGALPLSYQWQRNGEDVPGATNAFLFRTNLHAADAASYCVVVRHGEQSIVSLDAKIGIFDLGFALNAPDLVWLNSSEPALFAQSIKAHDGIGAAALGPLGNGKKSVLQTTVNGPGTISFWWWGQGTTWSLSFAFAIDDKTVANFSYPGWSQSKVCVPVGMHALSWTCENRYSSSGMAYLDEIVFTPGTTPATITWPPLSQTHAAGTNMIFNVVAFGTPPMAFQWFFNDDPIEGATGSSLLLQNIQLENSGFYSVMVSNAYGMVLSSNATLTVSPSAPVLINQPIGSSVMQGQEVKLSGEAIGTSPISYQWFFNGLPMSGATNLSLILSNVQPSTSGNYCLAASNTVGKILSSNALLSVYTIGDLGATLGASDIVWSTTNVPWFPQTNTTHDGVSAAQSGIISSAQQSTLEGTVTGPATITYWWKVNCQSYLVNLAFVFDGKVQNAIAGNVDWQQVTNYIGEGRQTFLWKVYPLYNVSFGGTGWVDHVHIIPGRTAAKITAGPSGITTNAGNNPTFSVGVIGTPPFRYQWQFEDSDIPGATNSTLTLTNVQTRHTGLYRTKVSNDFSADVSSEAALVVNSASPMIILQPKNQSRAYNANATLSVLAKGSTPINYQWCLNGLPIPEKTSPTLSLTNLQAINSGNYTVIADNSFGSVTSSVAILEVNETVVMDFWRSGVSSNAAAFGLGTITAIAAGTLNTVALRQDGTVVVWGVSNSVANVPPGLSNVIAIAAGDRHSVALKSDGTIVAWGDNSYGQLWVPAGMSNVIAIAAAANHTLVLKKDGTVSGFGDNEYGQITIPVGLENVQSIAAGLYNGFALKADGTLVQWGFGPSFSKNGTNEQLIVAPGMSDVNAVAVARFCAWSLHNDATVTNWGLGMPAQSDGIVALAASACGSDEYALALKKDGTVTVLSANPKYVPYIPPDVVGVVSISARSGHAAVLVNDGTPCFVGRSLGRTVYSGATTILSSGIVGAAPLSYQWQLNGINVVGATNELLALTNVPISATGIYRCIASNAIGSVTNQPSTLTVLRSNPQFSAVPSLAERGLNLHLDQLSGHGPLVIYGSSDLLSWRPIFTNPPVTGSLHWMDSSATNLPIQFYRAVEE